MKIKLLDKFKALGAGSIGVALLAVPFLVPEAIPALPLAIGGFLISAAYANHKLSGSSNNEFDPLKDNGIYNHGISKEDAIESMLSIRERALPRKDMAGNRISI